MKIKNLKNSISTLVNSINYYESIVGILKKSVIKNLEYYFIQYLIFLKKRKLKKLKSRLQYLENNKKPHLSRKS